MRKNRILLPFVGAFLLCIAGCDQLNDSIITTKCDHFYVYKDVDDTYHNQVCSKCGEVKIDSKQEHNFDPETNVCKSCSFAKTDIQEGLCVDGKHTWGDYEIIKAATCTESGEKQRTCTVCGAKEKPKTVKATDHDWSDDMATGVAATCTESGFKNQTCTRCNTIRRVETLALGHDWVDDETVYIEPTCETSGAKRQHCSRCDATQFVELPELGHVWVDDTEASIPATCTTAGKTNQHCERCQAVKEGVVIEALGHDFGDWTPVEGRGPTCTEAGEVKRVCSRCFEEEVRMADPLGHKPELVGDPTSPVEGTMVRVYSCANGCGEAFLGFRACEPSIESRKHLVIGDDGGVSFWGRPIGNALALDENGGSINQKPNDVVYCSSETGDFIEYIFNLTAEQAEILSTCRLYCDAKPANYLSGDFWAYESNSYEYEWTPGYYIDGSPDHIEYNEDGTPMMVHDHDRAVGEAPGDELETYVPMGKRISDYRYILYVDGQIQEFNPYIKAPVEGSGTNTVRKEYVMPFTFHLHEGENRIRLHMAGGYRSTFYNFTFRPYVEPKISFSANDVTDASKQRLNFDVDGGASYKGRPIGNAMALYSNGGSVNQIYDEIVYCSTETGDYFEYKFNLSAKEAQNFASCRLYCDAKPANYLHGDFWAYESNAHEYEWTPGYYIDGSKDHIQYNEDGTPKMVKDHAKAVGEAPGVELDSNVAMGKRVKDYRYVLYVDGSVKEFDSDIKAPVEGSGTNTVRKEYVMPFTFHLHEGENTIRLHMAGGYRSTFYNFTFRPC